MKSSLSVILCLLPLTLACGLFSPASTVDLKTIYAVAEYNPERDAFADLENAIAQADAEDKHIFLEIGGDWCVWCHILDDFISTNEGIAQKIVDNFVVVKINVSEENRNEAFMGQYPTVIGYPHFFILDETGQLLHSQHTVLLESDRSYDVNRFEAFLTRWSPK